MKNIILFVLLVCTSCVSAMEQEESWRFAVVGDTHVPQSHVLSDLVPRLLEDRVEVVLFVGDLVQGGKGQTAEGLRQELEEWKQMIRPLLDAGVRVLPVRGNHEADVPGDNDKIWMETFDFALNFSYDYRNVTFVGLDNYIDGEHTVDMDWLEQNIKEHEPDRLLVPFGHEPAFTSDTYHPWCLDANPENRNAFWQLLSAYNMPYYFCGHAHQYNKSVITYKGDPRIQIVCGGGGGNLQPQRGGSPDEYGYEVNLLEFRSEYGYLCVTVSGNTLNPQWRRVLPNENNISKNVRKIRPAGNKRRNQLKNIR